MEYTGIPYFPIYATFFEEEVTELLEAKFGMQGSYIVIRLLCKIYKEGYFITWGKDQCAIFLRKSGGEVKEETMNQIIDLLLEKDFFDKDSFKQHGVLTSASIQKVWMDATSRRKRDLSQLPYLLPTIRKDKQGNGKQIEDKNEEIANNLPVQGELNLENADNSRQSKVEKSKVEKNKESSSEEGRTSNALSEVPGYAYNQATHNLSGLMECMIQHKVTNQTEQQTILRLSDYGRKGTMVWRLFPSTNWTKIGAPGKFIIAALVKERKQGE